MQRALHNFETGPGDFTDYLIGHRAREAGCSDTVTLDRTLADSPLLAVLG